MKPFELLKTRELIFSDEPASQIAQAYLLLSSLENMKVEKGNQPNTLIIHYSLEHYTHEALQHALTKEGFHFKESFLDKMHNHIVHYCEDVQYHNLNTPEHPTKKNESEVFAKVYGQNQQANSEIKPKDQREYK